jgi:hypothetical protein
MVDVERFEAQVALLPLLVGDVRISRIRLIGVDLLLEIDGKGHGNWEVGTAKQPSTQQSPAPALGIDIPLVNELLLERVRLTYRDANNDVERSLKLNSGIVRISNRHSPIEVELRGAIDSHPVQLSAELGSLMDLMEDSSYGLKLNAQAGDANIALAGAVAKPHEGTGLNIRVSGSGKNLESVSGIVGASLPPVGPYSFDFHVSEPSAREILVKDLEVNIGNSALVGGLMLVSRGERPSLEVNLSSTLIDLRKGRRPRWLTVRPAISKSLEELRPARCCSSILSSPASTARATSILVPNFLSY